MEFKKMHGSGNDFILVDNRKAKVSKKDMPDVARRFCKRHFGIGADGMIFIEESESADFKWHFYNADGSEAEMCGNGGRCAARFSYLIGLCSKELSFETISGIIRAEVFDDLVKLQLTPPRDLKTDIELEIDSKKFLVHFIDTGVPHAVIFCKEDVDVKRVGRAIRFHDHFAPAGTNVNFVEILGKDEIKVRTYERGVEDETYACGTGAVASSIIAQLKKGLNSPIKVTTSGGERLKVYTEDDFKTVFLEGNAVLVYSGKTEEL